MPGDFSGSTKLISNFVFKTVFCNISQFLNWSCQRLLFGFGCHILNDLLKWSVSYILTSAVHNCVIISEACLSWVNCSVWQRNEAFCGDILPFASYSPHVNHVDWKRILHPIYNMLAGRWSVLPRQLICVVSALSCLRAAVGTTGTETELRYRFIRVRPGFPLFSQDVLLNAYEMTEAVITESKCLRQRSHNKQSAQSIWTNQIFHNNFQRCVCVCVCAHALFGMKDAHSFIQMQKYVLCIGWGHLCCSTYHWSLPVGDQA